MASMATVYRNLIKFKTDLNNTKIAMTTKSPEAVASRARTKTMTIRTEAQMLMTISQTAKTTNKKTQTLRVTIKMKTRTEVAKILKNSSPRERSASINSATQKRFTRSLDQKLSMPNTGFCAGNATKTTVITTSVNSANKSTLTLETHRMMINGLAVTSAIDGYLFIEVESY